MVGYCGQFARENRQRDKKRVAHPLEEEAATKLPTEPRPKTKRKTTQVGCGRLQIQQPRRQTRTTRPREFSHSCNQRRERGGQASISPQSSSSDTSSLSTSSINNHDMSLNVNDIDTPENNLALDEDFWSEVLSSDNSGETRGFPAIGVDCDPFQPMSPLVTEEGVLIDSSSSMCDGMDFWCNVYARAEEFTQLLEL
ncbi:myb-related protein Myb4 [Spatholobus suberectus]|nr:myb-related protein Myb4 [Spatholobus suberectus]